MNAIRKKQQTATLETLSLGLFFVERLMKAREPKKV
jgi:hypothetical protein